jgi:hypothetical protein
VSSLSIKEINTSTQPNTHKYGIFLHNNCVFLFGGGLGLGSGWVWVWVWICVLGMCVGFGVGFGYVCWVCVLGLGSMSVCMYVCVFCCGCILCFDVYSKIYNPTLL